MEINRNDALRYMGQREEPDEKLCAVMDECEKELLENAKPRNVWRVFDVIRNDNSVFLSDFALEGNDIKQHIQNCEKAALVAVTLSASADKFLKKQFLADGLYGLVSDAMASVLIEQVLNGVREEIIEAMYGYSATWCYAAGYGDFPLETLPKLVEAVDASRKIGVSCTASNMLTPQKSIVGIIGLSTGKLSPKARGCAICNMRETCTFRKNGAFCKKA